jgi:hypothetical protein
VITAELDDDPRAQARDLARLIVHRAIQVELDRLTAARPAGSANGS